MTIIQNLLNVPTITPTVSNTTETGQQLFKIDDTEIVKIPKVTIPTLINTNLSVTDTRNGYAEDLSIPYIDLGFYVWFNGKTYNSIFLGADSYIVFNDNNYSHNTNPTFTSPNTIPYDKIFICASTGNEFYGGIYNDINKYGYNGPVKITSGTTPNKQTQIIYGGFNNYDTQPLVWSITFYESGYSTGISTMDIHINTTRSGVSGFYDRTSGFKSFNILSNSGYRVNTFSQTRTWTCPQGVYEVSAVCVGGGGGGAGGGSGSSGAGGGGLGWKNTIPVSPGSTYDITVGKGGVRQIVSSTNRASNGEESYFISNTTVAGKGGQGAIHFNDIGGTGGTYVGDGGGNGGDGGTRGGSSNDSGGGGGAGGYSGNGGNGGNVVSNIGQNGSAGSGGAGGGGGGSGASDTSGSGGGVGIYGEGSSGSGGSGSGNDGGGGTGGSNGENATVASGSQGFRGGLDYRPSKPGDFGGGGAGSDNTDLDYEDGGNGAVRLIWGPRLTRKFPSRNTQDLKVSYRYIKWEITEARSSSSTQVAEFILTYNQSNILYPYGTIISSSGGLNPSNLIDSSTSTKFTSSSLPVSLTIDLLSSLDITGYKWTTADDDNTQDPKSWIIYGSNDNSNWTEIDSITDYIAPTDRETFTRTFYLPIIPR